MKTGTIVRAALILFILGAGNILLFGLLRNEFFTIGYFVLVFACFVLILWWIRDLFNEKGDLFFIAFAAIALSISISFFAGSLNYFYQSSASLSTLKSQIGMDNKNLLARLEYSLQYADYLENQIRFYENSSVKIDAQLKVIPQNPMVQPQVTGVTASPVNNPGREEEYEQEYEDD